MNKNEEREYMSGLSISILFGTVLVIMIGTFIKSLF